ncbi:mitochondrial carrier domain-containing protein [Phakopsora pachyrhizi]|uniref:Mitochondrial carrier domain-containing protein n=1 Tax=Phakopsora pachyrhizi TaxID=170000 RepID=A0AAV0BHB4_PHAPC|nr:mitochondrial carrier domain-containing protein [Phakopsora pachyrhizi]CAH7686609.1 mitochondrial carrier domain-containing protein [Phakopsora pachyrhizi]
MGKEEGLTPFGNALAGAIGGVISNAVVYPLDTVKTKIQATTEGINQSSIAATSSSTTTASSSSSSRGNLPSPKLKRPNAPLRLPSSKITSRQIINEIFRLQGIGGFYRGFLASMLNTFSMQFAYFYWYTVVRKTYKSTVLSKHPGKTSTQNLGIGVELALGALAGAIAQIFTIPVSVVATRQQLENSRSAGKSLLRTASEIVKDDGLRGLWRGLKPSLVLTINPAITYGSFERLKVAILGSDGKMTAGKAFWIGALSKTLATIVTYPYIMAKVRLQAKYEVNDDEAEVEGGLDKDLGEKDTSAPLIRKSRKREKYSGALDVLKQVLNEKGILGWYQGMQAQIIKAVLSQALLFGIKDILEDYTALLLLILGNHRRSKRID